MSFYFFTVTYYPISEWPYTVTYKFRDQILLKDVQLLCRLDYVDILATLDEFQITIDECSDDSDCGDEWEDYKCLKAWNRINAAINNGYDDNTEIPSIYESSGVREQGIIIGGFIITSS